MNFAKLAFATIVASASLMSTSANAAVLLFELTGSRTATFTLDTANPDATTTGSFFQTVTFNNVDGTFNGTSATATNVRFDNRLGPALVINGSPLGIASFQGPDLFTGSGANAVFSTGVFALTSATLGGNFRLSISPVAAAVPEPATWAMLILGFGTVGGAMRRRANIAKASRIRLTYA